MIFQINYKTDKYDWYIEKNQDIIKQLDYKLFDDDEIDYFLSHYKWKEQFDSIIVHESEKWQEIAIKCDFLRLLILYELGGTYIDVDVIFYDNILNMESYLDIKFGYRNVVTENRSLYFIRGIKHSSYIKSLIDVYLFDKKLSYDITQIPIKTFFNFRNNVAIIGVNTLEMYFYHKPHGEDK